MRGQPIRLLAVLLMLVPTLPAVGSAATLRVVIDDGLVAALDRNGPYLEAEPQPSEGLLAFADRLCGDRRAADGIAGENGGRRRLLAGVRYRVPFACLVPKLQQRVLDVLLPGDGPAAGGWRHTVTQPTDLWQIAEWLTGSGENFRVLRELNGLSDESLVPGSKITVPASLLSEPFRSRALSSSSPAVAEGELEYGSDEAGRYASYRLEQGEALYSSVVVRFTGRLFASDVNPLAQQIARRSGIADVTDIPVGYEIKIPFDVLSPEFLPPGHPRRTDYERNLSQSARYSNSVRAKDLQGVVVILDAGHGGRDVGASTKGVWESLYVYDIVLRIRRLLEQSTAAEVLTTTRDGDHYEIEDRDVLSQSVGHAVLVHPRYEIETGRVSTNLRWYLANHILAQKQQRGGLDSKRIVFLSIHADSLHPSLRGAMVYVPGLLPIPNSYGKTEHVYMSRNEVKARPRVSFTRDERIRSEGLSRDLAGHIVAGFEAEGVEVHPNQPVRDRIIRGRGRPWVPAVLRYNAVPAKVLVEVCNLANRSDREAIQTREQRERVARAIVAGLLSYYGYDASRREVAIASGG